MKLICFILLLGSVALSRAAVQPGDDFNADTAAAVTALQSWRNSTNALWKTAGWWNAANCVEALENAMTIDNGKSYRTALKETFRRHAKKHFLNDYYDDEGWWALAWIHAYDLTGETPYLNMARTIFQDLTGGWDDHCGGGIWWSKQRNYKNAIPNELFLSVAVRLHQRTPADGGPGSYMDWANREWAWFKNSGMINSENLVNDGLTADCQNNHGTPWTYNQGVILGALTDLYKVTGDTNYLAQAEQIADAAINALTDENGILTEPCENRDCHGGDTPQFKGIFIHNLAYLYDEDRKPAYFQLIFNCAHAIWSQDRNNANQLGLKWAGPLDEPDAMRQSSAIMPLSVIAEPATAQLLFAKGSGSPAFNHSVGRPAGTLAWACDLASAKTAGYLQSGPYLASLPAGKHTVHFRLMVDAFSASIAPLVRLEVRENNGETILASRDVVWNLFTATNEAQDFAMTFTNDHPGDPLEFRIYWNAVAGSPTLTASDVTVDGAQNWTAANLSHGVGRLDGLNAWEADPIRDHASGFLTQSAGAGKFSAGKYDAQFELKVDNFIQDNQAVATLSVANADTGVVLGTLNVNRGEFSNALYHTITVPFRVKTPARLDFRVYWLYSPSAPRLTQRSLVVTPAP